MHRLIQIKANKKGAFFAGRRTNQRQPASSVMENSCMARSCVTLLSLEMLQMNAINYGKSFNYLRNRHRFTKSAFVIGIKHVDTFTTSEIFICFTVGKIPVVFCS